MCLTTRIDCINSPKPELRLDSDCDYIDWDNLDAFVQTLDTKQKIVLLHIRGLKGKYHDLIELICKLNYPDIIILCETWLKQSDSQPQINGYNFIGHHRINRKGGGVGFLVKTHFKYRELPDLTLDCESSETVFIEIKGNHHNMVIGSIYQPPNTSVNNFLTSYKELCHKLDVHKRVVIGLDHNLDLLKSSLHSQTQQFLEATIEHNLIPTITKPTRLTQNSATLIDNIFLRSAVHEMHQSKIIIDNISDHYPSLLTIENLGLTKTIP